MRVFIQFISRFLFLVLLSGFIATCSSSTGGTSEYTLSTNVTPSNAGSVSPSSGTYEDGTSVSLQASPNEGWEFRKWSGDVNSSDNPLSLAMNSNKSITANFAETESKYTVILTVEDSTDALELQLGQQQDATNGFDEGIDQEAPPDPPEGALHAYLQNADVELFKDFRSSNTSEISWDVQFQHGTGDTLRFNWSLEITDLNGSLLLENPGGTIQIDMTSDQELNIPASQEDNLIIRYSRDSE